MSENEVIDNYMKIKNQIKEFSLGLESSPELLVVSKYQSEENIRLLHEKTNQKIFGENYVQELMEKSKNLPKSIKWHFIGHLQSNKAKALLSIDNLEVIETVDSIKLAQVLNKACQLQGRPILKVMIQVKTSNEANKSGAQISEVINIFEYIISECKNLKFQGLMTMGDSDVNMTSECFNKMVNLRKTINKKISEYGYNNQSLECKLSMGTTRDMEIAIKNHSNEIRIGSAIFGRRVNIKS
ncbi:Alanine racemase [Cryptosporidium sp. chipmunk genotype I]|uniref:Alanine racemase n=1 Tax=Cryptosporidium sp. chipmunk genotype I TaxID=1280935 RepID=UPI003519DC7F|nr:Alanine racemase [Cryptosporidium sp. chipmunk genotype I]